jgi:DNA repair photolyase
MYSGKQDKLPYSLSRWTDLPAAKWDWFNEQLDQKFMIAIDPRTALPGIWSLKPEDTYGLIFWTKNPENLVKHADRLKNYQKVVHMTLTGWTEVEKGAPDIQEGLELMQAAATTFGAHNVTWRFSPVPLVDDVVDRFVKIAEGVEKIGIREVYLAFLQENDLMPERRHGRVRKELLKQMAARTKLHLMLCNEDRTFEAEKKAGSSILPANLGPGICESGKRFASSAYNIDLPKTEGCGCALAVDPFTINETCTMGCLYCYAADKTLSPKKRNTTKRSLPMIS